MPHALTLIGAPSNIGIRPYDDGTPRGVDRAPAVLRQLGLADRLEAESGADVAAFPYREFVRPAGRPRHEAEVATYSATLADAIAATIRRGRMPILLGGDCSILLGALLGLHRAGVARAGLVYLDAHSDFATPTESTTGSPAAMCLAMAVGRGDTPLARLAGTRPLVAGSDVALVGRRDDAAPWYHIDPAAIGGSGILDLPDPAVRAEDPAVAAGAILDRVARPGIDGFWIHFDADVLDPEVMPAVDSPEPGGLGFGQAVELLRPLVRHPRALGLQVTIYDPVLDPDLAAGRRLLDLLVEALTGEP